MFLFLPFLSSKGEWLRRCSESWEKRRRRKGGQREELSLWPRGGGVGGGYSLVTGLWGCAAGFGLTFTNGLTVMGLHFYKSYENGFAHCQDFGGQKIQACTDLQIRRFTPH